MMETEFSESIAETGNFKLIQVQCELNYVHFRCRTGNAGGFSF